MKVKKIPFFQAYCTKYKGGIFSLWVGIFNLRSCHLRLTLDRAPLCSLILLSVSQYKWMNAIGQREELRSGQPSSIFEKYEPGTEPQPNRRSTWVCWAVFLWNFSLRWLDPVCITVFPFPLLYTVRLMFIY